MDAYVKMIHDLLKWSTAYKVLSIKRKGTNDKFINERKRKGVQKVIYLFFVKLVNIYLKQNSFLPYYLHIKTVRITDFLCIYIHHTTKNAHFSDSVKKKKRMSNTAALHELMEHHQGHPLLQY